VQYISFAAHHSSRIFLKICEGVLRADSEQIWGYPLGKDDFDNVTHLAQRDPNKQQTNIKTMLRVTVRINVSGCSHCD
jgi:hypothetical protein